MALGKPRAGSPAGSMYELLPSERKAIINYALEHPEVRHRELAWKMLDEGVVASQLGIGEAQTASPRPSSRKDETMVQRLRKPGTLMGSVIKRCWGASGGWRQNDEKVEHMNQGDLSGVRRCSHPMNRDEEPPAQESERP
jgi:hypothetical protein